MQSYASDDGVFIRSMASRGHAGGLAASSVAAATVLDAAGFDLILLETVGTGQSEVEVAAAADTTVVLEAPEMGDEVQAIKAGLLEVADIVVVNKGDRPGAQRAAAELRAMLTATATPRRAPAGVPGPVRLAPPKPMRPAWARRTPAPIALGRSARRSWSRPRPPATASPSFSRPSAVIVKGSGRRREGSRSDGRARPLWSGRSSAIAFDSSWSTRPWRRQRPRPWMPSSATTWTRTQRRTGFSRGCGRAAEGAADCCHVSSGRPIHRRLR